MPTQMYKKAYKYAQSWGAHVAHKYIQAKSYLNTADIDSLLHKIFDHDFVQGNGAIPGSGDSNITSIDVEDTRTVIGIDGSGFGPDEQNGLGFSCLFASAYETGKGITDEIVLDISNRLHELPSFLHEQFLRIQRHLLEIELAIKVSESRQNPVILLDGKLSPWITLHPKHEELKKLFQTFTLLLGHIDGSLICSVISNSQSRSVVTSIQAAENNRLHLGFNDQYLFQKLLGPQQRSPIFMINSRLNMNLRKSQNEIFFCYLNVNNQILRIEFPHWIAMNSPALNTLCSAIYLESKATAYPYVLSQAHNFVTISQKMAASFQATAMKSFLSAGGKPSNISPKALAK